MRIKLLAAAAVLAASAAAQAQTTSAYTFTVAGSSSGVDDANANGSAWFGGLLQSTTALGTHPDNGSSFSGLSAGADAPTAQESGGYNTATAAVPEPESYALMLAGLAAGGFIVARRRDR